MTKAPKNWRKVGYLIPEEIDPDKNICVCVPVPKDWGHIRAFMGQLTELSKWLTWEKDGTDSAARAARRWLEITECVAKEIDCIMANDCGCSGDDITNQRYTPDGHLEVSHDGGDTYENADDIDPRFNSPVFPPLPGDDGDEKKCTAANALVAFLKEQKGASSDVLGAAGGFAGLVVAVAAAVAATGVGIVAAVVIALMGGILHIIASGGQAIFDDSFTDTVWDKLLCAAFCRLSDDGSFDEAGWQGLISDAAGFGSYPADAWLSYMIKTAGLVGATNMARSGIIGTASCDSCACEDCSNLTNWEVVFGTIITQSPGYMKLSSVSSGSGNVAIRLANYHGGDSNCCAVTYNVTTGVVQNQAYYPCGSGSPVFSVPPPDTCMYDIGITNIFGVYFEAEFFFGECP